jgi:hypothetical protein
MERVEEGSVKITAGEFPAFMYASNIFFHPKKEYEGLFRGYLLVRVSLLFLFIFVIQIIKYLFSGISSHIHGSQYCIRTSTKHIKDLQGPEIPTQKCDWSHDCVCLRSGT